MFDDLFNWLPIETAEMLEYIARYLWNGVMGCLGAVARISTDHV